MAGFNRFRGGGLGSMYSGTGNLGQGNSNRGRNDGRDVFDRRNDRDFGRRDQSPRRRSRFSPDPAPYSNMRGRRDNRSDSGGYSLDTMGNDSFRGRGQRSNDSDFNRAGQNLGPPNRGDGILGAKPGDLPTGSKTGSGLSSQLAQQQQQQLMAMMQTQSLLAALQAQAQTATNPKKPPSLLQGMRMNDRGMDRMNNRKRRFSPNRGQMRNRNMHGNRQQDRRDQGRFNRNRQRNRPRNDWQNNNRRDSDKKSQHDEEPFEEPYEEEIFDDEVEEVQPEENKKEEAETTSEKPEASDGNAEETLTKEESAQEEEPKAEQEKSPSKSSMNLAGQDVNKLTKTLFDNNRKKYVCKVCRIMCTKETCFRQHLFGRRHVKTWIESQGQSFEAVIFKKATEEAAKTLAVETSNDQTEKSEGAESNAEQPPETAKENTEAKEEAISEAKQEQVEEKKVQVFEAKYSCDTRKMAVKEGEFITITSINEARVKINGFDTGLDTGGCEFVKAVSGFHCRLCKTFITYGGDVMKHVKARRHQANYKMYLQQHPKYEENQKARNKELDDMLTLREGEHVLLYEVSEEEEVRQLPSRFGFRNHATVDVKPLKLIAQHPEQEADQSMEDKDAAASQEEASQNDTAENDKSMEGEGEEEEETEETGGDARDDVEDDAGEEDASQEQEQEEHEEHEEQEIELDDSLLEEEEQETEMEPDAEKITSEDIADISLEPDISLSELASEMGNAEEPQIKKPKVTALARRGRKSARGAARGGSQGRGRGRGRGGKRNTRQSPMNPKNSNTDEDDDFMEGFEVIDEAE